MNTFKEHTAALRNHLLWGDVRTIRERAQVSPRTMWKAFNADSLEAMSAKERRAYDEFVAMVVFRINNNKATHKRMEGLVR